MAKRKDLQSRLVAKVVDGESGVCAFCNQACYDEIAYGKFYSIGDIYCHYFCVLLSCCLVQRGRDEEGLLGFLYPDILNEIERSKKHKCSYCGQVGATMGCAVSRCSKQFHMPCGRKQESMSQFFGNFKSFCSKHAPRQKINSEILQKVKLRVQAGHKKASIQAVLGIVGAPAQEEHSSAADEDASADMCVICYELVDPALSRQAFWPPCCARDARFHRYCLERMALTAGIHFLKCPLCNDKEVFSKAVLEQGYYVPDRDAAWELEQNAFADMYHRDVSCSVEKCACPRGRRHDVENGPWDVQLCLLCGSCGAHAGCLPPDCERYVCAACQPAAPTDLLQLEEKMLQLEEEQERKDATPASTSSQRPVMPSRMSLRLTKGALSTRHREMATVTEVTTVEKEAQSNTVASRLELNLKPPRRPVASRPAAAEPAGSLHAPGPSETAVEESQQSPLEYLQQRLAAARVSVQPAVLERKLSGRVDKPRPLSQRNRILNAIYCELILEHQASKTPLQECNSPLGVIDSPRVEEKLSFDGNTGSGGDSGIGEETVICDVDKCDANSGSLPAAPQILKPMKANRSQPPGGKRRVGRPRKRKTLRRSRAKMAKGDTPSSTRIPKNIVPDATEMEIESGQQSPPEYQQQGLAAESPLSQGTLDNSTPFPKNIVPDATEMEIESGQQSPPEYQQQGLAAESPLSQGTLDNSTRFPKNIVPDATEMEIESGQQSPPEYQQQGLAAESPLSQGTLDNAIFNELTNEGQPEEMIEFSSSEQKTTEEKMADDAQSVSIPSPNPEVATSNPLEDTIDCAPTKQPHAKSVISILSDMSVELVNASEHYDESSNSTFQLPPEFIAEHESDQDDLFFDTPKKSTTIEIEKDSSMEISNDQAKINIDVVRIHSEEDGKKVLDGFEKSGGKPKKCALKFNPNDKEVLVLDTANAGIDLESFKNHYLNEVVKECMPCHFGHNHESTKSGTYILKTPIDFALEAANKKHQKDQENCINTEKSLENSDVEKSDKNVETENKSGHRLEKTKPNINVRNKKRRLVRKTKTVRKSKCNPKTKNEECQDKSGAKRNNDQQSSLDCDVEKNVVSTSESSSKGMNRESSPDFDAEDDLKLYYEDYSPVATDNSVVEDECGAQKRKLSMEGANDDTNNLNDPDIDYECNRKRFKKIKTPTNQEGRIKKLNQIRKNKVVHMLKCNKNQNTFKIKLFYKDGVDLIVQSNRKKKMQKLKRSANDKAINLEIEINTQHRKLKKMRSSPGNLKQTVLNFSPENTSAAHCLVKSTQELTPKKKIIRKKLISPDTLIQTSIQKFFITIKTPHKEPPDSD